MPDTRPAPSAARWLRLARTTPLRDAVRGRWTGRLDADAAVASAGLPAPAADLVRRVVRRTRLWRGERADVARELSGHFAEGLAAGESAGDLVAAFGDERVAARLIRRAKRRGRPLVWKALRLAEWGVVGLGVGYAGLAAYFHAGRPTPTVDYVAVLNAHAASVPPADRAWPIYREALLAIGYGTGESNEKFWDEYNALFDDRDSAGNDREPPTADRDAWLRSHAGAIALARRAAAAPALGFVLGPAGPADDPALFGPAPSADYGPPTVAVSLPFLNSFRFLADVLRHDAEAARRQRDRGRLLGDVDALLGTARQLRVNDNLLLTDHVAFGIQGTAVGQIAETLQVTPDLLADGDLRDLAHHLSGPGVAADLFSLSGDRATFRDVVQSTYTDGGPGGGRLTHEGLKYLGGWRPTPGLAFQWNVAAWTGPAAMASTPLRDELLRRFDARADAIEADWHRPLREVVGPTSDTGASGRRAAADSRAVDWSTFGVLADFVGSHSQLQTSAERYLGHRDGVTVALALELYRRRHGTYPDSLDALVPDLLPAVPVDRITGDPVRYRLLDGRPVVYSVGADGDDDGGRVPVGATSGEPEPYTAAVWGVAPGEATDGDWVLHPTP